MNKGAARKRCPFLYLNDAGWDYTTRMKLETPWATCSPA